jgi:RsiW-degrading membrane proteinase PrsW (M82 family)
MEFQPSEYFLSFFSNVTLAGVLLALVFGAICIACFYPPLVKRLWLLEILAGGAIITLLAVSFIQIPIRNAIGKDMAELLTEENIIRSLLLNGIPIVIVAGLVQEGAKLISPVIYWLLKKRTVDPKFMLIVGAVAGAGFGIFEAQYLHNIYIASGWNFGLLNSEGPIILFPFIGTFLTVAFHTGACALTSYGLARGFGWIAYPVIAIVNALMQYSNYLAISGIVSTVAMEIYVAIFAVLVMAAALWLRWKKGASSVNQEETAKA